MPLLGYFNNLSCLKNIDYDFGPSYQIKSNKAARKKKKLLLATFLSQKKKKKKNTSDINLNVCTANFAHFCTDGFSVFIVYFLQYLVITKDDRQLPKANDNEAFRDSNFCKLLYLIK